MAEPVKPGDRLPWAVGFKNYQGMYLTVETFNHRVNLSSKLMKKKQIFQLEQDEGANKQIFIRTHLNRYLTAKPDGTFGGDAETKGPNEVFTLEPLVDGRFVLVSAHGYLVGGHGEKVDAYTKPPPGGPEAISIPSNIKEDRIFIMQLAMHPQVTMWNVNRKTFVHLKGDKLTTDEVIPWGADATINIHFFDEGKYGLVACDGRYLSASGQLKTKPDESCKFVLRLHGGQVAFTDSRDKYLTSLNAEGELRATKDFPPSKDELYVMEDSHPQIKMTSWQGKKVSVRAGVEINANQVETTDSEMFQIEIQDNGKWALRTFKNTFWRMADDGAILSDGKTYADSSCQFQIEWRDAKIAIVGPNGKYVATKKNGALAAIAADANDEATYVYELTNRPKLILRGEYGFVGTMPSGVLESNKSQPEAFNMEVVKGVCHISNESTGQYWKVSEDGSQIKANGSQPDHFYLVFVALSKFCIKYYFPNGNWAYLKTNQNGALTVDSQKIEEATMWEY